MDPKTGVPKAIVDGSHLTDMHTGAVTAIGPNIWMPVGFGRSRRMLRAKAGPNFRT